MFHSEIPATEIERDSWKEPSFQQSEKDSRDNQAAEIVDETHAHHNLDQILPAIGGTTPHPPIMKENHHEGRIWRNARFAGTSKRI